MSVIQRIAALTALVVLSIFTMPTATAETDQSALAAAAVKEMKENGRYILVMPDLEVVPPSPAVAADLRAYSGLLSGKFYVSSGVAECEVWVERIRADGAAFLTYGCNDPKYGKFVGRYRTKIESSGFSFNMPTGATVSFERTSDMTFKATHSQGNVSGEFQRRH